MTAAQKAKAAGLKNLATVSQLTGQNRATLRNWSINKPALFDIVLIGCVAVSSKGKGNG